MEDFNHRVGIFFALVGFVLLALFFASDVQKDPQLILLLLGSFSFFSGIWLIRGNRPQPQKAERFKMIKRLSGEGGNPDKKDNDKDIDNESEDQNE